MALIINPSVFVLVFHLKNTFVLIGVLDQNSVNNGFSTWHLIDNRGLYSAKGLVIYP